MNTPHPFSLDLTVRSHGFWDLAPWSYDRERQLLARPLRVQSGRVIEVEVSPREGDGGGLALRVTAAGRLSAAEGREARAQVRTCLALEEDLAPFYAKVYLLAGVGARPGAPGAGVYPAALRWAADRGAGRLLRSPTVFEDAVKTLCTTNCSWALTRAMTRNLVEHLGEPSPRGGRAFPSPHAMAAEPEGFYRERIRAGYRAGALRALARDVASGALDVEGWRASPLSTDVLAEQIRALSGFGPYATEHLLRLLGRYDHLALDSWTRAKLARLRGKRRVPSDATFHRWFAPYGDHAGLAMWLEVTADWHGPAPTWP